MAHIKMNLRSEALGRSVSIHVYLPSDGLLGEKAPVPYKTLYFMHGMGSCGDEMADYMPFRLQSELSGAAIVVPDGENMFYADYDKLGIRYATFIGSELVAETRKLFPLSSKREDTYIGGLSMGGFGALEIGAKFRETFSKVAILSPAADLEKVMLEVGAMGLTDFNYRFLCDVGGISGKTFKDYLKLYASGDTKQPMFIGVGTDDAICLQTSRDLAEAVKASGNVVNYCEMQGGHDIFLWAAMFPEYMRFLVS